MHAPGGAPFRYRIDWRNEEFYDRAKLDAEMRRVFDVCHGCRRCFNLCDSFPRLFDLIDESETGELDSVASSGFKHVVDACTLCDMCFMVSCPYVPPHEFNIDFSHLMLRYRAAEYAEGKVGLAARRLADTDANGRLARRAALLANWASDRRNRVTRWLLAALAGVHPEAQLPKYHGKTFLARTASEPSEVNKEAPAYGRKAVVFATCFVNYNDPPVGRAARAVLARNGVETEVVYPGCCGMPRLEQGDIGTVAERARKITRELLPWLEKGFEVISLVPSCTLMMKFEWPLMLPEDAGVGRLAMKCFDIGEYVVDIARKEGLASGLVKLPGPVTLHIPCHERAQNMGRKSAEMLALIPDTEITVIERCSGHGGTWGVKRATHEVALKVGRPVARQALEKGSRFLASECPLAAAHIFEGMEKLRAASEADAPEGADGGGGLPAEGRAHHPIELFARAYGVEL